MPGKIQTNPRGFLNLFGLKTTGRSPEWMADQVIPTSDATKLYELGNGYDWNLATGTVEPGLPGNSGRWAMSAPLSGVVRRVYGISVFFDWAVPAAGLAYQVIGRGSDSLGSPAEWIYISNAYVSLTSLQRNGFVFPTPIDLLPGWRIGYEILTFPDPNLTPYELGLLETQLLV